MSAEDLMKHTVPLNALSVNDEIFVWDQLFFQLLKKNNPTLRQACNNLLIANHFIKTIKNESLESLARDFYEANKNVITKEQYKSKFIKRLANAKIVVPKVFTTNKDATTNEDLERPNPDLRPSPPLEHTRLDYLSIGNKNAKAIDNHRKLKRIQKELKRVGLGNSRNKTITETLNNPESRLESLTKKYLENHDNKTERIFSFYKKINRDIIEENRTYRVTKEKLLDLPNQAVKDYCYLFQLDTEGKLDRLTFTIKMPKRKVALAKVDLSIYNGNKVVARTQNPLELENDSLIKTYDVFPDSNMLAKDSIVYHIKGFIDLNDGQSLSINAEISVKDNRYYSCSDDEIEAEEHEMPELYGVNRIGMGVFRKVEQEVCCYVPGEVSHIENIMAREYKERSTRNFTSTENSVETNQEIEVETNSDTATTVRNEVQKTVSEVLSNSKQFGIGASAGVESETPYGTFSAEANFGYAMTNAASNSDSEATVYAQEITSSAAEKILQKTSEKRTSKIVTEFEEKIRHGYDNREGDEHVTGIYRWIDIIYTNKLINYGNMEMVEFLIPEPSRFYKETILGVGKKKPQNQENDGASSESEWKTLEDLGIYGPEDIKAYNSEHMPGFVTTIDGKRVTNHYQDLINYYGVTLDEGLPSEEDERNITMSGTNPNHKEPDEDFGNEQILDGYELSLMKFTGHFIHNPGNKSNPSRFSVSAAGEQWNVTLSDSNIGTSEFTYNIPRIDQNMIDTIYEPVADATGTGVPDKTVFEIQNKITGMVNASLEVQRTVSYNVNIELISKITPEKLLEWKTSVFQQLEEAYGNLTGEGEAPIEPPSKDEEEELAKLATGNTALNRKIEVRELKRAAIEMITRPFGKIIGKKFLNYGKCRVNYPRQDKLWEIYSSHVKFFEQAFHWDIMAYLFYPYFWADRCDWKKLLKTEDPIDHIFEGFLQSGMARMIVPVRRGFESAVNYYFETGEIWNGGDLVIDTDDELYLSIDEELEEPESFVEEEWQTRIPTTLTLIQGDSAFLHGEGLPCCNKIESENEGTGIGKSEALLGVLKEN